MTTTDERSELGRTRDEHEAARAYTGTWCEHREIGHAVLSGGARVRYLRVGSGPRLIALANPARHVTESVADVVARGVDQDTDGVVQQAGGVDITFSPIFTEDAQGVRRRDASRPWTEPQQNRAGANRETRDATAKTKVIIQQSSDQTSER